MHIIASKPSNSFLCQEHELVNMKTTLFLVYAMCSFQGSVLARKVYSSLIFNFSTLLFYMCRKTVSDPRRLPDQ